MSIFSEIKNTISPAIIYFILDVEDILEKRENKDYKLKDREKEVLEQAIDFLQTAEKGREIVQKTRGTFVADINLIRHYSYISKALPKAYPDDIKKIIKNSKEILQKITDEDPSISYKVSPEDLSNTKQFFETLSDLSFNEFASIS